MRYILTTIAVLAMVVAGSGLTTARVEASSRPSVGRPLGEPPRDYVTEVRGIVDAVDRETKALRITHPGATALQTTLLMVDDTQVHVRGRPGSLADIQRGARIRGFYQDRYGLNLARSIEIIE
jgi:hypothetical protein